LRLLVNWIWHGGSDREKYSKKAREKKQKQKKTKNKQTNNNK
jgi:hypothetical protein